jgi:cobalt-zinc-cadmium efflux system membrane fusion protein
MIFAGMLTLASCNGGNKQTDNVETSQCDVDTEMVELYEMDDELVLNGNVVCDETCLCKVFVPCTGRVTDLKVEVGDKVSSGQLLAVIKSEGAADYRKSISDADAEIRMAERWFAMQQDLRGSGMASDKDVEEARERVMTAHAERLRLNDVASINGFGDGANASLMAPISGYVICKRIYNNSYVSDDNNDEAAIEIADLRKVWVIADVYESDIAKIRAGAPVSVTTMAYPNETSYGKIDKVYSVLDRESKTMKVRVCLDNPDGKLKPGIFANVRMSLSQQGLRMPAVPAKAVIFLSGKEYVMVQTGEGRYERREVSVAHTSSDRSFISSGLTAGEKVVTQNALLYFNASFNE